MLTAISSGVCAPMSRPAGTMNRFQSIRSYSFLAQKRGDRFPLFPACNKGHIGSVLRQRLFQRAFVIFSLRCNHDSGLVRNSRLIGVLFRNQRDAVRQCFCERGENCRHGRTSKDNQMWFCRHWFNEDIQSSSTMTHHGVSGNTIGWSIFEGLQRFLNHDRLRAAAADPSGNLAIAGYDRAIPRFTVGASHRTTVATTKASSCACSFEARFKKSSYIR